MRKGKIIYWLPRALAILVVAFFAMFILEGFDPEFGWMAGLMHLLLAVIILGITIIAWKWPKIGGWIFVLFGARMLIPAFFSRELASALIVGGIPLIVGILFLIEGFKHGQHQGNC
jgi:hypothetical protein